MSGKGRQTFQRFSNWEPKRMMVLLRERPQSRGFWVRMEDRHWVHGSKWSRSLRTCSGFLPGTLSVAVAAETIYPRGDYRARASPARDGPGAQNLRKHH